MSQLSELSTDGLALITESEIQLALITEPEIQVVEIGTQGPAGPVGLVGPQGLPGGDDFVSDPLAYYILAKN